MFLAPGHPQDGQVVFYKVSGCTRPPRPLPLPPPPLMPACPQISVDRGLKWEEAYARSLELMGTHDGFYLSYKVGPPASPRRTPTGRALAGGPGGEGSGLHGPAHRGDHCPARAAQPQPHARPHAGPRQQAQLPAGPAEPRQALHRVYKPNIGRQSQLETLDSLCRRFHRVGPDGPAVRPHCAPGAPVFCSPQPGPPPPCSAALAARRRMSGPGAFGPPVPHLRAGEHGQAAVQGLNRLCPQVTAEEAREHWESSYTFSLTHCSHTTW